MTMLTLELPPEAYRRLHEEANSQGKSPRACSSGVAHREIVSTVPDA